MFAGSITTANAIAPSTTTTIKKVKDEGDLHRTRTASGHEIIQVEDANGDLHLVCIC